MVGRASGGAGWTIGTTDNQTTAGTLISSGTHQGVSCENHGTTTRKKQGTAKGYLHSQTSQ
jgi:hypothetical protein